MKNIVLLLLSTILLFNSCVSTTLIQSNPSEAKVYINGEYAGTTPYSHQDTRIVGSNNMIRLEKEGYEELNASFSRDEEIDAGALVGALFFWFPALWIMKYKPTHFYEMNPISESQTKPDSQVSVKTVNSSKATKLRELKQLLDDKILTQEEFEKEKKKILAEDEK